MDIFNEAKKLESPVEIRDFIVKRLAEIIDHEPREIGVNTDTSLYSGFINPNIKINAGLSYSSKEKIDADENLTIVINSINIKSIKIDDFKMYWDLMDAIKKCDNPYFAVFKAVKEYLVSSEVDNDPENEYKRDLMFEELSAKLDTPISIKEINRTKLSKCVEQAAVAQNMFKFLGIESDYVSVGHVRHTNNDVGFHAFNIVYPEGRESYSIIFDTANRIVTKTGDYPGMFYLNPLKRRRFFENREIVFFDNNVVEAYKMATGCDSTIPTIDEFYIMFENGHLDTLTKYKHPNLKRILILENQEENEKE